MEMVHFIPPSQRRMALFAAQSDSALLISGAVGTGKGAIAYWIHTNGPRAGRSFLCASPSLPISQQILNAKDGTLVVPEIYAFSVSAQAQLLAYIRTQSVLISEIPRIGYCRVIATTSTNLEAKVRLGHFHYSLLKQLDLFRIEMPPLIERMDEFEDIVLGLLGEAARDLHKEHLRTLSPSAWSLLKGYDWPGNMRELRNVLRFAAAESEAEQIESFDLPDFGRLGLGFQKSRDQFDQLYAMERYHTPNPSSPSLAKPI